MTTHNSNQEVNEARERLRAEPTGMNDRREAGYTFLVDRWTEYERLSVSISDYHAKADKASDDMAIVYRQCAGHLDNMQRELFATVIAKEGLDLWLSGVLTQDEITRAMNEGKAQ